MSQTNRFAVALQRWLSGDRSQVDLARRAQVNQSALSRTFAGEVRPSPETFGKMLSVIAPEDPSLARDLLEAYLLDDVPEGEAPTGKSWVESLKIVVDEFAATGLQEGPAPDELELALAYVTKVARSSVHGKQFVLSFYRLRHRPSTSFYGLPDPGT